MVHVVDGAEVRCVFMCTCSVVTVQLDVSRNGFPLEISR